ncbi:thioredoxin-disulfide reductase [uncultured Bilophila sp.]|uniref:thioredoxin-disulfide reductase n=1 Tax=uncultured Bilophila sp. TaxID=529385 RepID=UPI0025E29C20|nr:thioredoxin-disulfide reductase [uncultured Bilophila sp.]
MKQYDAVVVGGGPAGITAALYLCRSGLSVAQIEMLAPGGQILKTESIENYPGFPQGIKGWEMADTFAAHLEGYGLERYNDAVLKMERTSGGWMIAVGKESIEAKAVVVCSGANPRPLGLPRESQLTGRGVSYCALCDGNFFRDQVVAVVGGGNSALEEALYLSRIVKKLYLIHRREGFRAAKVYQDKVRAASDKIELVLDTVVTGLVGEEALQGLQLKNVKTNAETQLTVDGMFVFVGYEPQNSFLPADLDVDPQGFIVTDCEMRTNLPGLFAAGDIRSKMCRQVATAVGDGATAATAAFTYLEQLDA